MTGKVVELIAEMEEEQGRDSNIWGRLFIIGVVMIALTMFKQW